ncbi:MAG: saccharopine dehydrogenase, partial [Actinomycetota bacterium]|nr:saccharopine dehydrogenase [Actinomycetota bacterium]
TAASMLQLVEEAAHDPEVRRVMADPYGLNPADARSGPDGPDARGPAFDSDFDQWTAPFVMAAINTRVVRRTNALTGGAYGEDFRYDEAVLTGPGLAGLAKATAQAAGQVAMMGAVAVGPLRALGARALPAPGEGPSREQREKGFFDLRLHAEPPAGATGALVGRVTGDRDPGYGSTSKMLGQAALCLAAGEATVGGGFWTPAAAMGDALLERLRKHAGLTFEVESA